MTETSDTTKNVRTRMAPSPTGEMHVGSMATLLKNYAWAKKHDGEFVLRIEDTDKEREVEGAVDRIQEIIKDYGLSWDEGPGVDGPHGPYIQSNRLEIYREKAAELVEKNKAYHCFCTKERLKQLRENQQAAGKIPRYDGHCRKLSKDEVAAKLKNDEEYVIRLAVPEDEQIVFSDMIRGEISFHSSEVTDQVLMKSDGYPTYHLAVVIDDHLMGITDVMRGEEWISSTPKHILLYRAFGWNVPVYAHLPLFLNPDGKGKMSKRSGTVSARSFLDRGYLPEALLNFFMILGWTPKDQRDILSLEEYIDEFDPRDMSANAVVFDMDKLEWLNGQYIRNLSVIEMRDRLLEEGFVPADAPQDERIDEMIMLVQERMKRLDEFEELTAFFYRGISLDREILLEDGDAELVIKQLQLTVEGFAALIEDDSWTIDSIEKVIRGLKKEHDWGTRQYFMMIRHAVSGRTATPPLFEMIFTLRGDMTMNRLQEAQTVVSA